MVVSDRRVNELREYLTSHESDIAHSIKDFDSLLPIFYELLGRTPRTLLPLPKEKADNDPVCNSTLR